MVDYDLMTCLMNGWMDGWMDGRGLIPHFDLMMTFFMNTFCE